jgi:hypothetical protein
VSGPVPLHRVEEVLLAELARGPSLLCDLAAALGRDEAPALVFAEAALRSLRARGLVRVEPGPDGLVRWRAEDDIDGWIHRPALAHGFRPQDEPELTPAQVAIHALEPKLADVRRILFHAGETRSAFRERVRRLAGEAQQLHREVLEALLAAARAKEAQQP